jgi:regulator of sigma E protease
MSRSLAILAFVVALVLAILIHELGHLLTAKSVGMKADRYFVGFGPTLWSTRRGETEYGVKAFPLGGFVSIRGMSSLDDRGGAAPTRHAREQREHILRRTRDTAAEMDDLEGLRRSLREIVHTEVGGSERLGDLAWRLERGDEGRFYHDRPVWQRALAIFMGPVTHVAIAFLLLFGLYSLLPCPPARSPPRSPPCSTTPRPTPPASRRATGCWPSRTPPQRTSRSCATPSGRAPGCRRRSRSSAARRPSRSS